MEEGGAVADRNRAFISDSDANQPTYAGSKTFGGRREGWKSRCWNRSVTEMTAEPMARDS